MVPVRDISKLAVNQTARIKIIGAGEVDGKVRRVASTIEPNSQLGQVFVSVVLPRRLLVNSSGRALIKTGQKQQHLGAGRPPCCTARPAPWCRWCGGRRIETLLVEVGLTGSAKRNVEIREGLQEGDTVVARAGALLREGDPVRPVTVSAAGAKK